MYRIALLVALVAVAVASLVYATSRESERYQGSYHVGYVHVLAESGGTRDEVLTYEIRCGITDDVFGVYIDGSTTPAYTTSDTDAVSWFVNNNNSREIVGRW